MQDAELAHTASLLTLPEAAAVLNVNERHVRWLVAERRVPFIKWGHLLRFDRADLESWIDGHRVEPTARRGRAG